MNVQIYEELGIFPQFYKFYFNGIHFQSLAASRATSVHHSGLSPATCAWHQGHSLIHPLIHSVYLPSTHPSSHPSTLSLSLSLSQLSCWGIAKAVRVCVCAQSSKLLCKLVAAESSDLALATWTRDHGEGSGGCWSRACRACLVWSLLSWWGVPFPGLDWIRKLVVKQMWMCCRLWWDCSVEVGLFWWWMDVELGSFRMCFHIFLSLIALKIVWIWKSDALGVLIWKCYVVSV